VLLKHYKNLLSSGYFDYLLVWVLTVLVLAIFYHTYLTNNPIDIPDDILPTLSKNWGVILSGTEPWYSLFINFLYFYDRPTFGISVNILQVFLISAAPITMYILLKEIRIPRHLRIVLSIFYVLNSIIFPNIFIFNPLMWPEFYIFMPLFGLLLLKFQKSGDFIYLFYFVMLISFYMEVQTSPNFYNVRLILPFFGLLFLASSYYGLNKNTAPLKEKIPRYFTLLVALFLLNIVPILFALGYTNQVSTLPTRNILSFYSFHIANVIFTYQSQNLFFAISGLVVYPSYSNSFLEGYHQLFFSFTIAFVLFILVMLFISIWASLRKFGEYRFIWPLILSAIFIWIFIASIQSGILLPEFKISNAFFLWEYPGYLETPLMFLYVIICAYSLSFLLNAKRNKVGLTQITKSMRSINRKNRKSILLFAAVFSVLLLSFSPIIATYSHGFPPPSKSSILPDDYGSLQKFFSNKSGNYKILPVPVNESIYTRLETIVNPDKVYVLPYAYQNNPLAYPNVTLYNNLYGDISSSNLSSFQQLLTSAFIKYIIVFNSSQNYKYVREFANLNYMSLVLNETEFTIFQYKSFSEAIVSEPVAVENSVQEITGVDRTGNISQINSSVNISSLGFNSSVSNYTPLKFANQGLNLSVLNVNNGAIQYSEIYKFAYIPPGADLRVSVHIISQFNSKSYLLLIYHNNLSRVSSNSIYSNNQSYIPIPINFVGNFIVNTTAPTDAEYLYFGILTLNMTRGNGSLLFSRISINNVVNTLNYSGFLSKEDLPVSILRNDPVPNLTSPGLYYSPFNLGLIADHINIENLSLNTDNGYLGLHNVKFSFPKSSGSLELRYYLSLNILKGSQLRTNGRVYNFSGNTIVIMAKPGAEINLTGFAVISEAWVSFCNGTFPRYISYHYDNSSESINASGNYTVELTTLDTNYILYHNVTVIREFTKNTQTVYILSLKGNSTIEIEKSGSTNLIVIIFNLYFITTFIVFISWLVASIYYKKIKR
jgi:hypothetical protein